MGNFQFNFKKFLITALSIAGSFLALNGQNIDWSIGWKSALIGFLGSLLQYLLSNLLKRSSDYIEGQN